MKVRQLCDDCMGIPVPVCLCATSESVRCRPSAWSEKSIMSGCSSASKASCNNSATCFQQATNSPNCMVLRSHKCPAAHRHPKLPAETMQLVLSRRPTRPIAWFGRSPTFWVLISIQIFLQYQCKHALQKDNCFGHKHNTTTPHAMYLPLFWEVMTTDAE